MTRLTAALAGIERCVWRVDGNAVLDAANERWRDGRVVWMRSVQSESLEWLEYDWMVAENSASLSMRK